MTRPAFEITVTGEMDQALRDEFEDVDIVADHSLTRLRVDGADAAVLHGVLGRVDALGLEVLDVHQLDD